jgi:hypothetical protein
VEYGTYINIQDILKKMLFQTAVSYYYERLNLKLFKELISLGVPLNTEKDEDKTALNLAIEQREKVSH